MTISEKVQPEKLSASILLRLDGRLIFPLKMSILLLAKYIGEPFEPFPDIIKITKSPKAVVMEVEPEPATISSILLTDSYLISMES